MDKQLIFIAEDDESIRELVTYALEGEHFSVRAFESAESLLDALKHSLPKLILLDIMLPGADGMETLRIIREEYRTVNIKVIMLTAKSSEINKVAGLNAGADDYITKPFSVLELVARVKANLRKYAVELSEDTLSFKQLQIRLSSRAVFIGTEKINLTAKEFDLLKILVQNLGDVVPREKLLDKVWGYDYFGQTRTLDIHINTLRGKLGGYADYILTCRSVGYVFKEGGL